ncbi:MAG: hypothetical protein IJ776_05870 [Paludibacteraceae bacterium]|nr:hypothetical protein [Paludibacteraceae bacterium]
MSDEYAMPTFFFIVEGSVKVELTNDIYKITVNGKSYKGSTVNAVYEGKIEAEVLDALENIKGTLDVNAPMYNVLGSQVDKSYKGVVIQNGRKYLLQ